MGYCSLLTVEKKRLLGHSILRSFTLLSAILLLTYIHDNVVYLFRFLISGVWVKYYQYYYYVKM